MHRGPILLVVTALSCSAALQLATRPPEPCRGAAAAAAAPVELRSRAPSAVGVEAHRVLRLRGGGSWSSWFKGLLSKLGIFSKTGKLLVLGLDNAGKSTLLTLLVRNEVVPHAPTHQPVTDMITIGSMKMRAVDMGGHEIARRMWEMYSQDADGIVYIVDAMDRERFPEVGLTLLTLTLTLTLTLILTLTLTLTLTLALVPTLTLPLTLLTT